MLSENKFLRILSLGPPTGSKPFAEAIWQLLSWFTRHSEVGGPDDLLADLEQEAQARHLTKSVVVCESLESSLRQRPRHVAASCYDLARDLAGSVRGLPRDLAHNPQYMEGFGE